MNNLVASFFEISKTLRKVGIDARDVTIKVSERDVRRLEDELLFWRSPHRNDHGTIVGIKYVIKPGV